MGLKDDANIITFKASKIAKGLKAETWVLEDKGGWDPAGGFKILLGQDDDSDAQLEGTFAMLLKDDYTVDMHITTMGRAFWKTDAYDIDYKIVSSTRGFLTEFIEIKLE